MSYSRESTEDKLIRQLELEQEMAGMGVTRYREQLSSARSRGEETSTSHGSHLLRAAIEPTSEGLDEWLAKVAQGGAGRKHVSSKFLKLIDTKVIALITAKVVLDQITFQNKLQRAAVAVGRQLEDQVKFQGFEEQAGGLWHVVNKNLNEATNQTERHRTRVLSHAVKKFNIEHDAWTSTERLHVGMKCIEIFIERTGLARFQHISAGKNNTIINIEATGTTLEWIEGKNARSELLLPVYLPTIIPPKEWTNLYDGGYHSNASRQMTLVKTRNKNALHELNSRRESLTSTFATVNALQNTGWTINRNILEVLTQVWEANLAIAGIPSREPVPVPTCPIGKDTDVKALTDEQKKEFGEWKREAAKVHNYNASSGSKKVQVAKILAIAEKFKDEEVIHFPHTFDFRGRVYATPMFLNPQGTDMAKGLLKFHTGAPIVDQEAADWLAIQGANVYGCDKVSLTDRILWAELNTQRIIATAENPFDDLWWSEADKPFQFLAWAIEWAEFKAHGWGYVSSLPIALDGSANGLQHYSAMLLDKVGGKSVNLTVSDVPQDLYQDVANLTIEKLRLLLTFGETIEEQEAALKWLEVGVTRKMTKKPVMVVPYSGTLMSCRKYLYDFLAEKIADGMDDPFGDKTTPACALLARVVWAAIGETVIASKDAMSWLSKAGRVTAKEGLPIVWTTPDGFTVVQSYAEQTKKRVRTHLGKQVIYLTLREDKEELAVTKMANAIAPNFVHSIDGCHLRMAVVKGLGVNIKNYAMVHDSYGTLAAQTGELARCLREAFVELYSDQDVLAEMREQMGAVLDDPLPEIPPKGDLDLTQVISSKYFFA